MNLPVVFAILSAGILAIVVGSTYLEPVTLRDSMSEAARAALFNPSPIVERERHPATYRRG
jgi:hypothetical protein